MKVIKTICLATALVASSSTFANSPFSKTTINGIVIHDFGNEILINLPGNVTNDEKCSINNQLVLEKTHPFFKEMYSALLSVFHTNTRVVGWVDGCHSFGMPKLKRLDLLK